ncbi:CHASE domain-containing protein [Aeromonas veronii]|uniref:CHASE domain-containing protein n=1 Tax=Aeromonas veronii TaxID=654 RepID=UPI00214D3352|nr:CHASE domain-containing protein [Aeromonas veronii]MCR3967896.1 CHASE domain-containing protein [Aeromonas veronii]MCR3980377.1 CHASE domain-containing protein [Aeromonas veronii]
MALQQQKLRIHAGRRGILVFLSGLLLTAGLTLQLDRKQEQDRQEAYQNFTTQFADTVEEQITHYQYGLRGARGAILVAGEQGISRADFRRYSASRDMKVEFPGARGFGFIRRVPLADEAAFVARARQDDAPGFAIRQLQPHAGERYVIQYLEPQAGNQQAIGLDIASEANRKAAADAAMRSGQVQLTAPITLVQAMKAPSKSFLMLMPIYRDGMARDSEAQRVAATLGWSYAPILMDEVMGAIRINPELTQFTLSDVSDPRKPVVFYASRAAAGAVIGSRSVTKTILGRTWQIEVRFQPAFLAGLHQNNLYAVGLLGVLASLGFTIMVFLWSSRRLHQQQLIDAKARMAAIVESSIDGIIGKTLQGVVISWNRGAEEIFGYRADEALGKTMAQLVVPDDLAYEEEDILARICRGERPDHFTTRRRHKNGQLIDVSVSVSPIIDDSGRIVGASKTVRDITGQQQARQELELARQQAEQANVAKSQFLANMSHEIRTPMNAVLGMLQLVRQTPLDTRQQDYVVKAQSAAQSLLALLNDILDFSKIDAGKLELDIHAFSLEDMLRELAVVLSGNQHHKTVDLMFEVDPSLPLEVRGDKLRILQILINLGGNALKFTEAGQVVIHLSALRQDAASVTLQVSVTDTGIGITPEQLSRIFNGFTQAESSTTRRFGGSGLGLVICQRLVALMGSELRVDSEPGRGSCFSFELCLEVENKALSISVVAPDISHCHVLVVDDSEISREILVKTIEMRGWSCDAVESGAKALVKIISALKAGRPYDVALVDWRMPEMDGVATSKLIKQQFPDVACPVVIMLSAYGRELLGTISEQDRVIFRDILTKPITPQQLIASIARARQPAQRDSLPPVFELPQRLAGVRLLLVEDNALNRQVAGELLTHEGASVVMAEDGLQGVRIATQQPDAFDIIIMDIQMPVMDGLQATREIRAVPVLAALPILAMTANASHADREACLQAGMNDHVGKPIDIDEVVELILKLVQGKAVPAAGAERQPAAASETATAAEVDPLDRLMRRFGQNLNVYRQTLASFSIEACNQLDMLARQREAADVPRMAATFHALKGVAATVGATALAAQAAEWERQSRTEEAAEFCTRFDTEQLAALRELATRSEQLLMQALPEPQPEATVIPDIAATLSRPEWLERLRALLPPLESGNLEALDLLAALPASPPEERETMQEVAALVQSLQFPGAVTIIRRILERET